MTPITFFFICIAIMIVDVVLFSCSQLAINKRKKFARPLWILSVIISLMPMALSIKLVDKMEPLAQIGILMTIVPIVLGKQKLLEITSGEKFKSRIAWVFGAGLTFNACIFVPQLFKIWTERKTDGVSLAMLGAFCFVQMIGTTHGVLQKDKTLAFGMGLSLVTCGATTLSVIYLRYFA